MHYQDERGWYPVEYLPFSGNFIGITETGVCCRCHVTVFTSDDGISSPVEYGQIITITEPGFEGSAIVAAKTSVEWDYSFITRLLAFGIRKVISSIKNLGA